MPFHTLSHQLNVNFVPFLWIDSKRIESYIQNTSVLCKQSHSILLNNDQYVIKICKAQCFPKDYIRKYFGKSQAKREYMGAKVLNHLGIQTAEPLYFSHSLSPFSTIESIYVMSNLSKYLSVIKLRDDILTLALELVARDLKIMRDNNVFFKDLHLNNIMYRAHEIRWIDTDIKIIKNKNEYNAKWELSIQRMLKPLKIEDQQRFLGLVK